MNTLELLSSGNLISGSYNKYIIWNENLVDKDLAGNSAPNSIDITRIKQTASNQVIMGGSSSSIFFFYKHFIFG